MRWHCRLSVEVSRVTSVSVPTGQSSDNTNKEKDGERDVDLKREKRDKKKKKVICTHFRP